MPNTDIIATHKEKYFILLKNLFQKLKKKRRKWEESWLKGACPGQTCKYTAIFLFTPHISLNHRPCLKYFILFCYSEYNSTKNRSIWVNKQFLKKILWQFYQVFIHLLMPLHQAFDTSSFQTGKKVTHSDCFFTTCNILQFVQVSSLTVVQLSLLAQDFSQGCNQGVGRGSCLILTLQGRRISFQARLQDFWQDSVPYALWTEDFTWSLASGWRLLSVPCLMASPQGSSCHGSLSQQSKQVNRSRGRALKI